MSAMESGNLEYLGECEKKQTIGYFSFSEGVEADLERSVIDTIKYKTCYKIL